MPECQKIKKDGLDQYGAKALVDLFLHNRKKRGTERVKWSTIDRQEYATDVSDTYSRQIQFQFQPSIDVYPSEFGFWRLAHIMQLPHRCHGYNIIYKPIL